MDHWFSALLVWRDLGSDGGPELFFVFLIPLLLLLWFCSGSGSVFFVVVAFHVARDRESYPEAPRASEARFWPGRGLVGRAQVEKA